MTIKVTTINSNETTVKIKSKRVIKSTVIARPIFVIATEDGDVILTENGNAIIIDG